MYMYMYIYIYICTSPLSGTYLFPVLYVFGYFRHLGCKEYCTMFVPVSRCHLRNCVCCVMVLPVFVTYVPESALFTADRATADVDETLVHVAYMHICGRGSGVTCLRRRDLLSLKSQHRRLNTDQGVKVITRTTTISSSFDYGCKQVKRSTEATMDSFTAIIRPNIRVTIDKRVDGKDSAGVDVEVRHEHLQ